MSATVEGLDEVTRMLNEKLRQINSGAIAGLLAGGLIIQRGAQERVPVDTGNLKGSAFTRKAMEDPQSVEVGFAAAYAIFVHENLENFHPNGEAKFLENSMVENADLVVRTVASYARPK